jgi:DNA repair protein RecN (Recombination protein N)
MLRTLYISNYALIDELEIEFGEGLSIITGETGAGKSIILGALSLILGDRADVKSIRHAEKKTVVEASFDITQNDLKSFFEQNDIDYDEHCIIRREITPAGRSRAFVNDTPVNVSVLKDLAVRLVDIHSQHSNMLLADAAFQLYVLDVIGQNESLLSSYSKEYATYKTLQRQLRQLKDDFEKSRAEEDYIRFQLSQLQEMNLKENEDAELEMQQNKLSNVASLKESVGVSEQLLNSADGSVLDQLREVLQRLEGCEEKLPELKELVARVRAASIDLKDVSQSLFAIDEDLVDDPQQLELVESRLNDLFALERKHHVTTVNELLEIQRSYADAIQKIDGSDEEISLLEQRLAEQQQEVQRLACELSTSRKKAANQFIGQLLPLAQTLGMNNLQFNISFSDCGFGEKGSDSVEFSFAFNKNQALMPVKTTASGGEISRLMLCVKSVLAHNVKLPTLIFDEVDTGVSGDMASRVGCMMGEMSDHLQVISITHLPQVAAYAHTHFKVYKTDEVDSTVTHVDLLDEASHVQEVARMLSGKDVNLAAIENAKSLISQANVR